MDILVAILIFVAVVVVAALLLGGWVIVSVIRLLARAVGGGPRAQIPPARAQPPRLPAAMAQRVLCGHSNCRSANPPTARFCRRCGRNVGGPAPVRNGAVVRRVAMW